ncbi:MAG TPA: hypothetical protein VLC98_12815 [Phnomibacter sp.]|nr:hypothetical protein [Phnomibacter sp.]
MINSTRKLAILVFLPIILIACSGAKKTEKILVQHYGEIPAKKENLKNENVIVETKLTEGSSKLEMSKSELKYTKILPLILWIEIKQELNTRLNQQIPVNQFTNALNQYARTQKITEKLAGKKISLQIEQLPYKYSLKLKSRVLLLFIAWDRHSMVPGPEPTRIKYTVTQQETTVKTGTIEIPYQNNQYAFNRYNGSRKALLEYFTTYDAYLKSLGKVVMDKIVAEL